MRAVTFNDYGGPEVVGITDLPEPHPGPGQVRVAVAAASINPIDLKRRRAAFPGEGPVTDPRPLGNDASGVVDEIGPGVSGVALGDAVFGTGSACQSDYALLDLWTAKPAALTWPEAAALGVTAKTAGRVLQQLRVGRGSVLFIDGSAGGVGRVAIQLAVARGARVIGSASVTKQDAIAALGAEPVTYGAGVVDRVRELVGADQVDAVLDAAGRTPLAELVTLVDQPAQVVTIANFAERGTGARLSNDGGTEVGSGLAEAAGLVRTGRLTVEVSDVLPFAAARRGHERAERSGGKIVLVPSL